MQFDHHLLQSTSLAQNRPSAVAHHPQVHNLPTGEEKTIKLVKTVSLKYTKHIGYIAIMELQFQVNGHADRKGGDHLRQNSGRITFLRKYLWI